MPNESQFFRKESSTLEMILMWITIKKVTFPLNFLKTEMTVHNYIMGLIKG